MHVSSLARKAGRGSAVGWFLVLLLICGAGAGYYLYQDNQEKKRVAQELTAERQAKEKAMKAAAEKQRKQREKEIRERREKEREAAELLKRLEITISDLTQPVRVLSGGQRQALTLMMATYNPPKLLLLDEHTAALDPATAEKVLEITKNTVEENHLTCMMITHNMQSALELGNRTIMMNAGKIILDVTGEERAHMTVADLLDRFKQAAGKALDNDRMLLSEAE